VIENTHHYQVTKQRIAQFEASLASLRATPRPPDVPVVLHQAMQASMESQLADLRQEVAAYEAAQAQRTAGLELHSLRDLPDVLIHARLARGYTQAELAARVQLTLQQVQRYEATHYHGVSFRRLLAIAQALEVDLATPVRLTG